MSQGGVTVIGVVKPVSSVANNKQDRPEKSKSSKKGEEFKKCMDQLLVEPAKELTLK